MRGVGVAVSTFVAGSTGFDGLFVIKPDGRMYMQSGVGNLGTESFSDVHRVAAEMMGVPWDKVVRRLGRHLAAPAMDVRVRRQPDDACDDARRARGGVRCHRQGQGDRGEDARRQSRVVSGGQRARVRAAGAA